MTDDYDVGYGKPPKDSQFKKGQSGNPSGRPKATHNFKTDLKEELQERVRITEGGKVEEISKQRAVIKRMVEQALQGNARAGETVIKWLANYIGIDESQDATQPLNRDDMDILERFLAANHHSDSAPTDISNASDEPDCDKGVI